MQQKTQQAEELPQCLMRAALLKSVVQLQQENTDFNLQEKETPADGVITGYGVIDGNLVYVYSQDASVLKGAIGEMHAKKIANIYDMAMKMGAPVIGLIDCAGLRLQEATDALEAFGSLYFKQAMASGVIPQITAVFGMCGGGLAVVPGLTDFTFMENKEGKLFDADRPGRYDCIYQVQKPSGDTYEITRKIIVKEAGKEGESPQKEKKQKKEIKSGGGRCRA
mgnify:CR=1 FL=1